ncbi:MAG: YebC/PmpR family DNA-binding transcriptional regulator [Candidatus Eisenbacteria bacterium]|nr:YebC/PmpR family DNA-binding transcriptional regulator [Candidatus Latescibacterota bacterium]MBD3301691.1 YebC/PmpR family DNA-binding transcriptional regulator [Candidatus Eisenbacteria bacterium]
MSGHSKWSTIKRKKGKADAERGKIFTKLIKEITIAARDGGGDPVGNARLRTAIANAKAENMPAANIDRAIKKGTGELPGVTYEEHFYEGYGPGGAALLIQVMTDNKNRTTSELRHLLSKHGGNLGEAGCVAWMFETKGQITVPRSAVPEERLFEIALEAGAEDVDTTSEDAFEVLTAVPEFDPVQKAIEREGIELLNVELARIPSSTVTLDEKSAESFLKLLEVLEEHDDVQKVFSNFDISTELLEKLRG